MTNIRDKRRNCPHTIMRNLIWKCRNLKDNKENKLKNTASKSPAPEKWILCEDLLYALQKN